MPSKWICLSSNDRDKIIKALSKNKGNDSLINKLISSKKTISVASRKGKGRGLQMWVAKRISKLIEIPFDNQDDQCLIHCREMGQSGVDIILRGKAQDAFPYSIECKNSESLNIVETVRQAKSNEAKGTDWIIVHKKKALSEPIAIMSWNTFEKLFKWIEYQEADE